MKSILLDHFFVQLLAGGLLKLWHMYCVVQAENSIVHIANYSSLLTEVATPILLIIEVSSMSTAVANDKNGK